MPGQRLISLIKLISANRLLLVFYMVFLFSINLTPLLSQNNPFPDTIKIDSADAAQRGLFDKENRQTFKIIFSGKPAKAALFSLLIPGGGQAYNRKYWKIPIAWGLVGYFGYQAYQFNKDYKEMDKAYRCMLRGEECQYTFTGGYTISDAKTLRPYRDKARSASERNWVTFSAIYLLQVIEAYIDRHLIDFDLDENLALTPSITPGYSGIGVTMQLNKTSTEKKNLFIFE